MSVYIYIKMIAAGSQHEPPGGSAKADTLLSVLSLHQCPHLCWSGPSPQPHVCEWPSHLGLPCGQSEDHNA